MGIFSSLIDTELSLRMRNETIGQKGQELVENYFKRRGFEIEKTYEVDNALPYDLAVRKKGGKRWMKIQVKTTRGPQNKKYVFRTRKTSGSKKVNYEPGDLDMFIFVDAKTNTMMQSGYSSKGFFSFSAEDWKRDSEKC